MDPLQDTSTGEVPGIGQLTAQCKPAVLHEFSLGNAQENGQPGFGSQQIIITIVPAVISHIITDG